MNTLPIEPRARRASFQNRAARAASFAALLLAAASAGAGDFASGPKLVGKGAVGTPQEGHSVALSADGSTALVGGPADNGNAGAAWVFTRSGGGWTQQGAKLVGTGETGAAARGGSGALSSTGNPSIVCGDLSN